MSCSGASVLGVLLDLRQDDFMRYTRQLVCFNT